MNTIAKNCTRLMLTAFALLLPMLAGAQNYGLPSGIQQGNILHCFNWTANEIKTELPKIAAAGFGSVQMSPLQRPDVKTGSPWHDLYRPYDLAFKSSSYCSEEDLRNLCAEASKYGIKVIVDVVANHVDKTAGYHDPWWDSNNRVRWEGGINYGNRYSITHGQLGDYGDVNSEHSDVIAKGKAYVEKLKSLGVKGIRWDAAKHIATPSEGCGFWSAVTSVPGMWHYGEILNDDGTPVNEYVKYMSITDNRYSNGAAQYNDGIQQGFGGEWNVNRGIAADKLVYWGESHDTYSNDEWSQNVSQSVIDRAYACVATRNGATALYLARPNTKGFNNIKVGKGSTAYTGKHIAEVNKFRNAMTGKADWVECAGNTCCVTRQNGGAVIVMKGSGNVTVKNGGGYCPSGTYTDRVSGGTFTVTSSTISGNVGSSGIAVIYNGGTITPDNPDNPDVPAGSLYILGNLEGSAGWGTTPGTGVAMTQNGSKYTAKNVKFTLASGETKCYFNITDFVGSSWDDLNMGANRYGAATEGAPLTVGTAATMVKYANNVDASGCLSWTIAPGTYDVTVDLSAMTIVVNNPGTIVDPDPEIPDNPDVPDGKYYCYFENTRNWNVKVWAWNDAENCNTNGTWPGDDMTSKNGKLYWEAPDGKVPTGIIFSNNGGDKAGGGDLVFVNGATYRPDGSYTIEGGGGGGDDPVITTGNMWILGNLKGSSGWGSTPGTGVAMTQDGNKYTAKNVEFVLASGETRCYFNITDFVGSSWDDLNMSANRYGAATEGAPLSLGEPATMVKYANNVDASGCLSWTVEPGTYDVTADMSNMTVTVTKPNSGFDLTVADDVDAPEVYYNLSGVQIARPSMPGCYIVKKGNKASKVYIR